MTIAATATSPISERDLEKTNRALVRGWLYFVLLVLFALVLVGGTTRLTHSGLSITEWKPIHGVIPPLSAGEWQEEFAKYQQIPEYRQINKGMNLDEFKSIFWWEWSHRLLARGVGFVFAVPLFFLWLSGRLESRIKPKLAGILLLGAIQGGIGWWMVASGLVDRTDVSQYRLATHLTIACIIFVAIMAVARGLAPHSEDPASRRTQWVAGALVFLVLFQIYLGGLVAGLDAGMAYNTWPLMDGSIVPSGLLGMEPVWRNFFESAKTVQFIHRIGAYTVFIAVMWHALSLLRAAPGTAHAHRAVVLAGLVCCQVGLGIATLLTQVQLHLALTHQAVALITLGFATAHWRGTKGAYPMPTEIRARS
jgi:cytochrome c oxidase assembly protein subunit 15